MLFNSIPFLVFFPAIFISFYLLPPRWRWLLLIVASYFFYMYWEPSYIFLLGFATVLDYVFGLVIYRTTYPGRRKALFLTSIIINLGVLFAFKYFNFFNESLRYTLSKADLDLNIPMISVLLPVGISFYTFHSLSYIIDIYLHRIKPEKHWGKYALFVAFFPLLVAGPIERANHLLPQLQKNDQKVDYHNFVAGMLQAAFGFFKKVVVADTLAIYVNSVYNNYEMHTGFTLLFATYIFAFQIYCDFSGYSDIALGVAKMMGYDLLKNFHLPYFSKNITEFWRRWHISLSSWLRDYLYIPLGGNRHGSFNTYKNLIITFLLGGLWHGASWNFVIWGALNGLYLAIENGYRIPGLNLNKNLLTKVVSIFFTFHLICLTWVFFRAESFHQATYILRHIFFSDNFFNLQTLLTSVFGAMLLNLALLLAFEYLWLRRSSFMQLAHDKTMPWQLTLVSVCVVLILLFGVSEGSQFIYFQF